MGHAMLMWCWVASVWVVPVVILGVWLRWLLMQREAGFVRLVCVSLAAFAMAAGAADCFRFGEAPRMPWLWPTALGLLIVNFLLRHYVDG